MTQLVTFPGIGLELEVNRVAFTLFGKSIFWYGIIIAVGFLLAAAYCSRKAPRFGVKSDDFMDMLFFAVPIGLVGARLYYVLFNLDYFRKADGSLDFIEMVRIWDGGIAIYGGVIAAVLTALVFCKIKKIRFLAVADVGVFGLFLAQAIGRWGNFVNVEAYGSETTLPWRMGIEAWSTTLEQYVHLEVHPTFLYESVWNGVGFVLLMIIAKNWRKFDGQLFLTYVAWYGIGRAIIEGLRTDSLYFFGLSLFGAPIRTSQVFALLSALVAIAFLVVHLVLRRHTPAELYVNCVTETEKEAVSNDSDGREGPGGES